MRVSLIVALLGLGLAACLAVPAPASEKPELIELKTEVHEEEPATTYTYTEEDEYDFGNGTEKYIMIPASALSNSSLFREYYDYHDNGGDDENDNFFYDYEQVSPKDREGNEEDVTISERELDVDENGNVEERQCCCQCCKPKPICYQITRKPVITKCCQPCCCKPCCKPSCGCCCCRPNYLKILINSLIPSQCCCCEPCCKPKKCKCKCKCKKTKCKKCKCKKCKCKKCKCKKQKCKKCKCKKCKCKKSKCKCCKPPPNTCCIKKQQCYKVTCPPKIMLCRVHFKPSKDGCSCKACCVQPIQLWPKTCCQPCKCKKCCSCGGCFRIEEVEDDDEEDDYYERSADDKEPSADGDLQKLEALVFNETLNANATDLGFDWFDAEDYILPYDAFDRYYDEDDDDYYYYPDSEYRYEEEDIVKSVNASEPAAAPVETITTEETIISS